MKLSDSTRAYCLNNLGLLYLYSKNKYNESINKFNESLAIRRDVLHDELSCAVIYNNIGLYFDKQNKYQQSVDSYKNALIIWQKYPKNEDNMSKVCFSLGSSYLALNFISESIYYFKRSIEIFANISEYKKKKELENNDILYKCYKGLYKAYEIKGNKDSTSFYHEKLLLNIKPSTDR